MKDLFSYADDMEVNFDPDMQARLEQLVKETGIPVDQLLGDALVGYEALLRQTREMLDSRYDDLASGRVKPVPSEEVWARLREKSLAHRSVPGS